ncbi:MULTISPECIES: DUF4079 domain-containing protein [unclassified Synechococcus]|uniref:DUF4079 domain-containing protein n=1 Tax=unclassified Synechococcus TaxID=2626047 RepID=UPI0000699011|nr:MULTISPECIES: DUF4079 domain-containing protein [unclassified Synechococcus]EAQ74204.1 hypothetical protein WH5701_06221 [Synechococcus sp. WH 5701]WFN60000.1 DUF4079 domain-containing protein [Synechococcus sp. CCFWC 502]
MNPIDWFALLHPVLVILFVYPVVGATIRLGILARERRLKIHPQPPTVGVEHADHGRWVTGGMVVAVLVALIYSFTSKFISPEPPFAGGVQRLALLLLVSAGTFASLLALWRVKSTTLRASFALLTWAGLLGLGSQPEIWRLSDNPFEGSFWASHYWSGVLLTGLMLFSMSAKPEIFRSLKMRRLHVSVNILVAVLLAVQAITGSRDLLEIPVSWQKPAIYSCDFEKRICPAPASSSSAADGLGARIS